MPARFEGVWAICDTDAAVLVDVEGTEVWIPKSLIHEDSEVYKADTDGELIIPEWLATEKGLT